MTVHDDRCRYEEQSHTNREPSKLIVCQTILESGSRHLECRNFSTSNLNSEMLSSKAMIGEMVEASALILQLEIDPREKNT